MEAAADARKPGTTNQAATNSTKPGHEARPRRMKEATADARKTDAAFRHVQGTMEADADATEPSLPARPRGAVEAATEARKLGKKKGGVNNQSHGFFKDEARRQLSGSMHRDVRATIGPRRIKPNAGRNNSSRRP